ncbi:hypothetical protein GLOIN_2v1553448, partial [Rhizophagus irregularis DAOM 181602=DAOM 197198]
MIKNIQFDLVVEKEYNSLNNYFIYLLENYNDQLKKKYLLVMEYADSEILHDYLKKYFRQS